MEEQVSDTAMIGNVSLGVFPRVPEVADTSITGEDAEVSESAGTLGSGTEKKTKQMNRKKSINTLNKNDKVRITEDTPNTVAERENVREKKPKMKSATHPQTSEMVLECFGNIKKRNGISVEEIRKYVEENYDVNINRIKPHIKKFLLKGVADGMLQRLSGSGADGKFVIKKAEKVGKKPEKIQNAGKGVQKITGKIQEAARKAKSDKKKIQNAGKDVQKITGKIQKAARKAKNDEKVVPKKRLA